jgi:hypothetical protein
MSDERNLWRTLAEADAHLPPPPGRRLGAAEFVRWSASRRRRRLVGATLVVATAAILVAALAWPARDRDDEPLPGLASVDFAGLQAELAQWQRRLAAAGDSLEGSLRRQRAEQRAILQASGLRLDLAVVRAAAVTDVLSNQPTTRELR